MLNYQRVSINELITILFYEKSTRVLTGSTYQINILYSVQYIISIFIVISVAFMFESN